MSIVDNQKLDGIAAIELGKNGSLYVLSEPKGLDKGPSEDDKRKELLKEADEIIQKLQVSGLMELNVIIALSVA